MDITQRLNQGQYDITLKGRFTFNDHAGFRDILRRIGETEVEHVILHLEQVDFVDSAALGMLLLALDESQKHQKRLVLSGAVGQVKKMFGMARFDTLFAMN